MTGSAHLRGIVIAGILAAVALALGFVTLAMNQTASQAAPPRTILPLKDRHHATSLRKTAHAATKTAANAKAGKGKAGMAAKPKAKPKAKPDRNLVLALQAGLPRSVARALAKKPVAVVQLTSKSDPVAQLATGEALAGAAGAGASYVAVNVDSNGGDVEVLTRLLGRLPTAPATLIYVRPGTLVTTLPNFNDRTVVEQAAVSALSQAVHAAEGSARAPAATTTPAATGSAPATTPTPTTSTAAAPAQS